jgi:hypothetical protein
MIRHLKLLTLLLALAFSSTALADIALSPATPICGSAICLETTGNQPSNAQINAFIAANYPVVTELYKQNAGGGEEKSAAAWYTTTFNGNLSGGSIAWDGPGFITGSEIYLLVKGGAQIPAWYLFDVSTWNGKETITLSGFWPGPGSISHVSIYAGRTPVPDGGLTLALLGAALFGLETLRRRLRA